MSKKSMKSVSSRKNAYRSEMLYTVVTLLSFVVIAAVFVFAICGGFYNPISTPDSSINYEEALFEDANRNAHISGKYSITKLEFDPDGMKNGIYDIYINDSTEPYQYQGGQLYSKEKDLATINEQTTFVEFTKKEEKIIQSSRDLVCKYIQDSSVLTNKEWLIEKIQTIPFYKYSDSTHPEIISVMHTIGAHMIVGIYCYDKYSEFYCEYFFVHELLHHLRYLTYGKDLTTTLYYATPFVEAMTDIITYTIEPKLFRNSNYQSGYIDFYPPIYTYLSIFGRDALEAYFYGYDEFFETNGGKTFEAEHNLFAVAIGSYASSSSTPLVCDAIFNTWRTRQPEC